jgi:hypothetical protein
MSKVVEVANLMASNPDTTAQDVMKKFKISKAYAYNLMTTARKKFINRRNEALAKPKARMLSRDDYMLSKDDYVTASVITSNESVVAKLDKVNHPAHYKTGGMETIEFIEAKGFGYNLGNVIKYLSRADHKGNREEDLLKARWYLNREIAKFEKLPK